MCLPFDDLAKRTLAKGEHRGFEWEIVKNHHGHRCGYLRVLDGHPWFGKHYDEIDAEVHGGLTFADHGKACPTHGEKAEWWVGFDCAHAGDAPDPELGGKHYDNIARILLGDEGLDGVVRDHAYTQAECESLADQAAAA